jgi:glycosyltransferase involved in cell wall biosynthesis
MGRHPRLAGDTDPTSPLPHVVEPLFGDRPRHVLEAALARARGRVAPPPPWLRRATGAWQIDGPAGGPALDAVRARPLIHAVAAVWNEDDIVYALVEHLWAQGVDRVLVLDDDSDDATVQEAEAAGAQVLRSRSDGGYSEARRSARVRDAIAASTDAAGGDVWWLVVDADEFARGPDGTTVRDLVERAPAWVDVVGSRVLDHVPAAAAEYLPRRHPLACFPLARWYRSAFCGRGHWKHPLMRVRLSGDVYPLAGHHAVGTSDGRRAREYEPTLLTHHFPFRERERTEGKLRRAMAPGGRYAASPDDYTRGRLLERLDALDHLYAGRYERVASGFCGDRRMGIEVWDWRELVAPPERVP